MGGNHRLATPRDRALGAEIRVLRERAGLTLANVAETIQWNVSTLSRLERGQRHISPEAVMGLSLIYQLPTPQRAELLARAKEPPVLGWWDRPPPGVPIELATMACYEHHATRTTDWSPSLFPTLLHTPAYATVVIRDRDASRDGAPKDDVRPLLRVSRQRQEILDRRHVNYTAFIGAAALHNELCPPEDFLAQLQHVRELSDRDGIVIRLVDAATTLTQNSWYLMYYTTAQPIVLLEHLTSSTFLFDQETVPYTRARTTLDSLALSAHATRNRIDTLIKQHTDEFTKATTQVDYRFGPPRDSSEKPRLS